MSRGQPGPKHPRAKFTWKQVRSIRALWRQGDLFAKELAQEYGCSRWTIQQIVTNRCYTDPTYKRIDGMRDRQPRKGDRHPMHKLTAADVREIRDLLASGWSKTVLGRRFRVHRTTIGLMARGITWKHVK